MENGWYLAKIILIILLLINNHSLSILCLAKYTHNNLHQNYAL